jgi:hypothetical protein
VALSHLLDTLYTFYGKGPTKNLSRLSNSYLLLKYVLPACRSRLNGSVY